jgi:cyclohexanone monooxygenase
VVGAGFSGLYLLHRLRGLGLSAVVLEAGGGIGGTWYWNRYPGARCDVESVHYSYSFSPELEQEWEWSERYPSQPEILRYLEHVADRFALRDGVRLNSRVTTAHWVDGRRRWSVAADTPEGAARYSARWCVMATGCLSTSKLPEIPGLQDFTGGSYHTGHWPHEGVDFGGQRVAVLGTGSSAIQSIPVIAAQATELTVFQRTPNFSIPARNRPLADEEQRAFKARYRKLRQDARVSHSGVPPLREPGESALAVPEEERSTRYREGWQRGGLFGILGSYQDLLMDPAANDTAAGFIRERIRETVHDPGTAELLAPRNHPFGTKRPCLDTGYYEVFNRPHVRLVDVRSTPLSRITAKGVQTADGTEYQVDSIVFATGFDAMTGSLAAVDIRGRGGAELRERWAAGPRTYLGLAAAGFPNLFMVTGPGSPSVLSNMIVSIEQHVDWIADLLRDSAERGREVVEAEETAQEQWMRHCAEVAELTLYPRADSWYMGANVPGKPRVFLPYAGGVGTYREICDTVAAQGYPGFTG